MSEHRGPALIVSGSFEQARHYAKKLGLAFNAWRYATAAMTRGRVAPTVYVVGTWYERPDIDTLRAALTPCKPRYLDEHGQETTLG